MSTLNAVLEVLKSRPTVELLIQGNVCCTDSLAADALDFDTHKFDLSYARAKEVMQYLIKNGINPKRLTFTGYGSRRRIINPEYTNNDRNRNRRVDFRIVKK